MVQAMPQLTTAELNVIDGLVRGQGKSATEAWRYVNEQRSKHGAPAVHKSTVHRLCKGNTHQRGAEERRGRKQILTRADVRKLQQARVRLIKKADNSYRVTYKSILEEAALGKEVSLRVVQTTLRQEGLAIANRGRKSSCLSEMRESA